MGKPEGINNYRIWHWKVIEYVDDAQQSVLKETKYRTVADIKKDYPMFDRTKVYMLSNKLYKYKKESCNKYLKYKICKINEPITIEIDGVKYNILNKISNNNIEDAD